jgi:hypothetical protein
MINKITSVASKIFSKSEEILKIKINELIEYLNNGLSFWNLDGNAVDSEKSFGTDTNFSVPVKTNGVVRGIFDKNGNFGYGTILPTATVHGKGVDSTSSNFALKLDNLADTSLLSIRNDGYSTINGLNIGKGVNQLSGNTSLGVTALDVATGNWNTGIGFRALNDNIGGGENTAVGSLALLSNTTGNYNTAVGRFSNGTVTNGNNNTSVGYYSMQANTGNNNTAVGYLSMTYSTGSDNTAIGDRALFNNLAGNQNTAAGKFALFNNTTGANNTAVGYNALNGANTSDSVAMGVQSAQNATGINLTSIGRNALIDLSSGAQNTAIGYNTGRGITTGANNTILGANITGLTSSLSSSILIGNSSGLVTFYTNSTGDTMVGAGFVSATARVHVRGTDATASNFALKAENSASTQLFQVRNDGVLIAPTLPTSAAGLPAGAIWKNGTVLNIV